MGVGEGQEESRTSLYIYVLTKTEALILNVRQATRGPRGVRREELAWRGGGALAAEPAYLIQQIWGVYHVMLMNGS